LLAGNLAIRRRRKHFTALLLHFFDFSFYGSNNVVVIFEIFQEIADVQKSIAIQADVYEGRLHAGKHARDTAFIDTAD
jgi:hypothetical protein